MRNALCAGALALTISLALAAGLSGAAAQSEPTKPAELTSDQRNTLVLDLASENSQPAPSGFELKVGAPVPDTLMLSELPSTTLAGIPEAANMKFAKIDGKLLLVDRVHNRVVLVIDQYGRSTGSGD